MKKKTIIKTIQTHVRDFKGIDLKSFYEELGFDNVYTTDDSYMDYFKSNEYLESHVTDCERIKHLLENNGITIPTDDNIEYIKDTLNSLRINSLPIRDDFKNRVLKMRDEAVKMADAEIFLGIMVYAGSILEGIILGILRNENDRSVDDLKVNFRNNSHAPKVKEFSSPIFNQLLSFVDQQPNHEQLSLKRTSELVRQYNRTNNIEQPRETDFGKWELKDLLDVASDRDVHLLDDRTGDLSQHIRDARNYIHPNAQVENNCDFTSEDAKISVTCLEKVVNNLNVRFNPPQTT